MREAAKTLVEAGISVLTLDVGITDRSKKLPEGSTFDLLRKTDTDQHLYWLGANFEGIPQGHIGVGSQLPPARKYLIQRLYELSPLLSSSFLPMESLALGGLGGAWGLGCHVFSESELTRVGLNAAEMKDCYASIAKRIGISYSSCDIDDYSLGEIQSDQSAIRIDRNCSIILEALSCKQE